jgi:hypothetical protein
MTYVGTFIYDDKLMSDGSMPLLVSLNAEALVVYYYEKMVPDSAMSPVHCERAY